MKKIIFIQILILIAFSLCNIDSAGAYWLWTPETKKFINPKYAVKDSPKEQFDWAMGFYESKDYQKAAAEFDKLVKNYEFSEYAAKSQYYVGLSYENMGKYYIAFQNYQKAVDDFPNIENLDEIIDRQFNIGNIYFSRTNPKVMGIDIMTSLDRAVEIYRKVVENAPYGRLADKAQFRMGEALKRSERYDEAIVAFQRVVDEYPKSPLVERARYELAYSAYKSSLKPAYDIGPTDKAIQAFEDFMATNKDEELLKEADQTMQRLKDKAAEKSLITARFYERQKHYTSAIIYYQDIIDNFPDSSLVPEAKAKIEELKAKTAKK
jgi:outer membrane protein assembly factor BamD